MHGLQQVTHQDFILWLLLLQQAQLLPHVLEVESIIKSQILVQDSLGSIWRKLWCQSLSEFHQVPPADSWLSLVGVPARVVRGIANEVGIESERQ